MLLLKYNILSYKLLRLLSNILSIYKRKYVLIICISVHIFLSDLAYYLNTLLTSCKWFISHCVFVFHNILLHGSRQGPILMIMASANSSRKKRVGLADSQDYVNVGR